MTEVERTWEGVINDVKEKQDDVKSIVSNYMDFCIYSTEMGHHGRVLSRRVIGSGLYFKKFTQLVVWRMTVMGWAS